MKKVILITLLTCWAAIATAATPLPDAEKHRLAAYLSYITVGVETQGPGGGSLYTVGANCPECNGVGKVGDGVTMLTCEWEDGKYYCNKGKVAKRSDGDAMDVCEVGCALCESVCECGNCDGNCGGGCCDNCTCPTPKRDKLFKAIDEAPERYSAAYVDKLEYDLTSALQELETLKEGEACQQDAEDQPEETPEEKPEPEESSSKTVTLYRMKGSRWNWSGRSNPSTSFMRQHLMDEHGIDASLMNREQMQVLHDNAHNYGDDKAFGFPTEFNSSVTASDCPSGTCPTSSSSSGGCPGGNCPTGPSRSYSRGFFGRWR